MKHSRFKPRVCNQYLVESDYYKQSSMCYIDLLFIDWSSWESWTSCSVTCGSGMHVRYRTCNKTESTEADCEGQYVEQAVCELDDCPGKFFIRV